MLENIFFCNYINVKAMSRRHLPSRSVPLCNWNTNFLELFRFNENGEQDYNILWRMGQG